jgi:catechol 2,3-dioxygenase-like lactoylglutathione lyase family enzyme
MLSDYPLDPILATADIARAKQWYADKLGWSPAFEVEAAGVAVYKVEGATVTIYQTENAGTAKNTVAIWTVTDVRPEMERLRARGVTFEDYDFGDVKTVDGVMTDPDDASLNAWFLDPDGNTWSLFSTPTDPPSNGITPMLAASDLGRAKAWYRALGFQSRYEFEDFVVVFNSGGSRFSVYTTQQAGTAKNTVAGWNVKDLRAEMAALRDRGVTFEEYDFGGGFKTVDGVMDDGHGNLTSWFKDSEGNILGLAQEYGGD